MLFHHFQGIIKFMVGLFLVPTLKNLMVYILTQSRVCIFLSCTQPKSKKCCKSKNWVDACSSRCMEKYVKV